MEIYRTGSVVVRTFEFKSDEYNITDVVAKEDFGCVGNLTNYRPNVNETVLFLYGINDDKKNINQALIIEDNGDFKGYALVSKATPKSYLINQLAIKKEEQNKGYGTLLVNVIKASAYSDDCKMQTLAYSAKSIDFYIKNGIYNIRNKESSVSLGSSSIFDDDIDLSQIKNYDNDDMSSNMYNM